MANKRQHKRYISRCEAEFVWDNITYRGIASDFSLKGLFLRTNYPVDPDTTIGILIYLPNGLISKLTGKVKRYVKPVLGRTIGMPVKALKSGMGIEIIKKDANYLHFIRALLG